MVLLSGILNVFCSCLQFILGFYVGKRPIVRLSIISEIRLWFPVTISLSLWDPLVRVLHREGAGTRKSEEEKGPMLPGAGCRLCSTLTSHGGRWLLQVTPHFSDGRVGALPSWLKSYAVASGGCPWVTSQGLPDPALAGAGHGSRTDEGCRPVSRPPCFLCHFPVLCEGGWAESPSHFRDAEAWGGV